MGREAKTLSLPIVFIAVGMAFAESGASRLGPKPKQKLRVVRSLNRW